MDWSTLACGRFGHVTYAPDEPELRRRLSAQTPAGEAWRCLRCATFVTGPPAGAGPGCQAPAVRRGMAIRGALILRIVAVERFARGLLAGVLAYAVWQFRTSHRSIEQAFNRERPVLRAAFRQFGINIDHSKLVGLIQHALALRPATIALLAAALAAYAVIEVVEATGLWLSQRWGEYFAMVATSLGLPYEIYEMSTRMTMTKVVFFLVNLALVLYLVITRRLLGVRGGKAAYEARLRSESVLEEAASAVRGSAPDQGAGLPGAGAPPAPAAAGAGAAGGATAAEPVRP